jgi:hypothetical protein
MALHPNPSPYILLPAMHDNLAQIARTWVAAQLACGIPVQDGLDELLQAESPTQGLANRAISHPTDLIFWAHENTEQPSDEYLSNSMHYSHYPLTISSQSQQEEYSNNPSKTNNPDFPSKTPTQQRITAWMTIQETHFTNTTETTSTINSQFGTRLEPIDTSKTLRVIAQNSQYAFQIQHQNHEKLIAVESIYQLQASIFMNISPNVNFNNPSFSLSYKQPFKNTFSQIHLSATSSDIGKTPTYKNVPTLIGGAAI